jgi:hypothetical protein
VTKPRLTTGLLRNLWARREAGEKTALLAAEIFREAQVLRQYWRKLGLYSSAVIRTAENQRCAAPRIYAMRVKGLPYKAIADMLALPPTERTLRMLHNRLVRYCHRAGVPVPRHRAQVASVQHIANQVRSQSAESA